MDTETPDLKDLLAAHLPEGANPDRIGAFLARHGGVSRQTASYWLQVGHVPAQRIERVLQGLQRPADLRLELYRRAGLGDVAKLTEAV